MKLRKKSIAAMMLAVAVAVSMAPTMALASEDDTYDEYYGSEVDFSFEAEDYYSYNIFSDETAHVQSYNVTGLEGTDYDITFSMGTLGESYWDGDWDVELPENEYFSVDKVNQTVTFYGDKIAERIGADYTVLYVKAEITDANGELHSYGVDFYMLTPLDTDSDKFEDTCLLPGEEYYITPEMFGYIQNAECPEGEESVFSLENIDLELVSGSGTVDDVVSLDKSYDDFDVLRANGYGDVSVTLLYRNDNGHEKEYTFTVSVKPEVYRMEVYATGDSSDFDLCVGDTMSLAAEGRLEKENGELSTDGLTYRWSISDEAKQFVSLKEDPNDSSNITISYDNVCDNEEYYFEVNVELLKNGEVVEQEYYAVLLYDNSRTPIKNATFSVKDQAYTGKELTPHLTVKMNGTTLTEGEDYECHYYENVDVGTARIGVYGIGEYVGSKYVTFKITRQSGSPAGRWYGSDDYGWMWLDPYGDPVYDQWIKSGGNWYYIDDDGYMATNKWVKDSKGWCYVNANGKMVTNGWAKDSKGWCYLGSDGYMVKNSWKKDSKGWCYVGNDGHMVTNGWAKDSKGWCWMGADGYWVSNKWIQSGGQWYYIKSNHYMAANEWAKDSGGWMWMDANGHITKSKWIKSGGYWYYLKSNGYMATGTQKIGGKTYKFDSAGRWIS